MATRELRCEECGSIIGELINGALVIKSRHHGEQHVTIFSLATLLALAHADGPGRLTLSAEPVGNHHDGKGPPLK